MIETKEFFMPSQSLVEVGGRSIVKMLLENDHLFFTDTRSELSNDEAYSLKAAAEEEEELILDLLFDRLTVEH